MNEVSQLHCLHIAGHLQGRHKRGPATQLLLRRLLLPHPHTVPLSPHHPSSQEEEEGHIMPPPHPPTQPSHLRQEPNHGGGANRICSKNNTGQ